MFGFRDTDGDLVGFQLEGRYLNYWVDGEVKVKDLSNLSLQGRTVRLDGTSTGTHASARITTAAGDCSLDDLDVVMQFFKKRPSRALMCICSAGH